MGERASDAQHGRVSGSASQARTAVECSSGAGRRSQIHGGASRTERVFRATSGGAHGVESPPASLHGERAEVRKDSLDLPGKKGNGRADRSDPGRYAVGIAHGDDLVRVVADRVTIE